MPYEESLLEPYTRAAIGEVDWWAERIGPAEVTSLYIGGGTLTLALDSVAAILKRMRERFHLTGDICIETNPADVNTATVKRLQDMGVALVSLGVESFQPMNLATIGRGYQPVVAEQALDLLARSDFASVNVDLMFALPGQTTGDVTTDLAHAVALGADQLTTYPLFTFPYTSVGKYLKLKEVRMPDLRIRHEHYRAINRWCSDHGMRGTFANVRLRNMIAPGTEGGWTIHPSSREPISIYDAAMKYKDEQIPLLIIAGKEYGSGSSRDWAAKGPRLQGVRAVIAESFERIHRSNLVGMGVLPLQFEEGQSGKTLGLTGMETFTIQGIAAGLQPRQRLTVKATDPKGDVKTFTVMCRIDTPNEVDYYRHDGILQYVLRSIDDGIRVEEEH